MAKMSRIAVRTAKSLAELTEQVKSLRAEVAEIKTCLIPSELIESVQGETLRADDQAKTLQADIAEIKALLGGLSGVPGSMPPTRDELNEVLAIKPKPRRPRSPQGKKE